MYRLWESLYLGAIPIIEKNVGLDRMVSACCNYCYCDLLLLCYYCIAVATASAVR